MSEPQGLQRRRAELGAFLRARRRALQPHDVGIVPLGRRHVKGLRREEVAALAGIGVSWYTLLEQGVVRRVSDRTLGAIAHALRLDDVERAHVIALAAEDVPHAPETVSAAVIAVVERMTAGPAYLLSGRYDVLAWNRLADELFAFSTAPPDQRNLLRSMLLDPRAKELFVTWDQAVRDMVAVVRGNYARTGGPAFDALIEELRAVSPDFAAIWGERIVRPVPTHELCVMRLPGGRTAPVALTAFAPHDAPAHTVVCLVPAG